MMNIILYIFFLIFGFSYSISFANAKGISSTDLPYFSVNKNNLESAICKNNIYKSTEEIKVYFESLPRDENHDITTQWMGLDLKNENADLFESFKRLLTPVSSDGYLFSIEKAKKKLSQIKTCQKVFCASQILFGPNVGPMMLYLVHKFSINTSPYVWSYAKLFSESELKDIVRALEYLPEHLLPLNYNQQLIRFDDRYTELVYGDNYSGIIANSSMHFFEMFSAESSWERQSTVLHELAHVFAESNLGNFDLHKDWMQISQWKLKNSTWTSSSKNFISIYSKKNPIEDFAESFVAYRLDPKRLKKVEPKKFDYLKNMVFDGQEFLQNQNCENYNNKTLSWSDKLTMKPLSFLDKDILEMSSKCSDHLKSIIFNGYSLDIFKECVNIEALKKYFNSEKQQVSGLIPHGLVELEFQRSKNDYKQIQSEVLNRAIKNWSQQLANRVYLKFAFDVSVKYDENSFCSVENLNLFHTNPYLYITVTNPNQLSSRVLEVAPMPHLMRYFCSKIYKQIQIELHEFNKPMPNRVFSEPQIMESLEIKIFEIVKSHFSL